ncbi:M20 family metallopeptidase [Alkalicoccus daliensis]|uniref:Succinyl-diaminopimelate desuccinylase n=1 Tax=Alkalicoccus daliensis TaxID=745820 RepID=A0A1H0FNU4_9BACI|nr:M20/M25/M40 family metallo-hydrolase [Alkalicoccus daliensis]SDN96212.1 succinyl-diaminopimelate desuccinylase [Alkalicoccus daliensis]
MTNPIPLLKKLIQIDSSHSKGITAIINYCEVWLQNQGVEVQKLQNKGYPMLVAVIGSGPSTVVLNAHADVVEGSPGQFIPEIKGNKLYGRGAADMKAGLAAMMLTVAALKEEFLSHKVMLQIVPDEETGGVYGTKYLTAQGYTGDFIICGEPTNLGIAVQAKGVLQLEIELQGESAHSSRPWEGHNAIIMAYDLWMKIFELPFALEREPPMYDGPSINFSKISGGSAFNLVPKLCRVSLDIRYLPSQSPDKIIQQIKNITNGTVSVHYVGAPVVTRMPNSYVNTLVDSIREITSLEEAHLYAQHGSHDGKYFMEYGGSAVEFGPVGHGWHGNNEYVYVDSVTEYQQILMHFLRSL